MHEVILAPSILAGDHADLRSAAAIVEQHGLSWIHLDIMDGDFVPNLTFGPQTLSDLRRDSKLFFDTHLMLSRPDNYVEAFAKAGADLITIHIEPDYDVSAALERIKALGCQRGISLNPGTPVESLEPHLGNVELVLVMTVQPGFGGQTFQDAMLPKMQWLQDQRSANAYKYRIEVDGGINADTAQLCKKHGVDTFVAGSAFYKAEDKPAFIRAIQD